MKYNKYYKDNNIVHDVEIKTFEELKILLPNTINYINDYNEEFNNEFYKIYNNLNKENININFRYQKEYNSHGKKLKLNRLINQNINCYQNNNTTKSLNIYYDLITKYNTPNNIIMNTFIIAYNLIEKLKRFGYNINFIPVLFLKAFDKTDNNEYIYIKFNNTLIEDLKKYNIILNKDIPKILLPELIKLLDIENNEELDYNGYLLERHEKENIIELKNNDLIVDIFTSDELFNGSINHDSEIFYKKLTLK